MSPERFVKGESERTFMHNQLVMRQLQKHFLRFRVA
jgi:hypothetical protein